MGQRNRFLPAVILCVALTGTVNAAGGLRQGDSSPKFARQELSGDAQNALRSASFSLLNCLDDLKFPLILVLGLWVFRFR